MFEDRKFDESTSIICTYLYTFFEWVGIKLKITSYYTKIKVPELEPKII